MDFRKECTGQQARKGKKIHEWLVCCFIFGSILCLDVGSCFQWNTVGEEGSWHGEHCSQDKRGGGKKGPSVTSLHNSKRYQQIRRRLFKKISLKSWNFPGVMFYSFFAELLVSHCVRADQNCYSRIRCDIPAWKYHIGVQFHFGKEKPSSLWIYVLYMHLR